MHNFFPTIPKPRWKAQQAWPFKRSVVIHYTLTSDNQSAMPVFAVDFYGTFTMGSPSGEVGRDSDETQHSVELTEPYYVAVFETTQKQCEYITGSSHGGVHSGDTLPVEYICYNELRGDDKGSHVAVLSLLF